MGDSDLELAPANRSLALSMLLDYDDEIFQWDGR